MAKCGGMFKTFVSRLVVDHVDVEVHRRFSRRFLKRQCFRK